MTVIKTHTLEDQIVYQMADLTITEVAKQLEFLATEAYQSEKTIMYTKALKVYFIERLQNL